MSLPDEVLVYQPWGGLGDNMAHSVIPELCNELGIECFISKQNGYRNDDIREFIWGENPFVCGYKNNTNMEWYSRVGEVSKPGMNHIEAVQKAYGLPIKYSYPKIYYSPNLIELFVNRTVIDLSAHSLAKLDIENLLKILEQFNLKDETIAITHPLVTYGTKYETRYEKYTINSLKHYSDVLFSCKKFITLHSGQACLASTIKHHTNSDLEIHVISLKQHLPPQCVGYTFSNTNYIACD